MDRPARDPLPTRPRAVLVHGSGRVIPVRALVKSASGQYKRLGTLKDNTIFSFCALWISEQ